MLQRAASNAYSWWWASHIRTKQSKWLEQNLQDMEDKVNNMMRIIDGDGDSFAKRAEMYYRKRPELVEHVQESFRAYRALAERYDHLSKELQGANRTIASIFPERVQYSIDDDDDYCEEDIFSQESISGNNADQSSTELDGTPKPGIPNVPKFPEKGFRSPSMIRKSQLNRNSSTVKAAATPKSGLSKTEALEEIDTLQKEILARQTEMEFVKSLYERECEKYWEIENHITSMQKRVRNLQDEFGIGTVIEDDEARTLMTATALKSCQETLTKLLEEQEQTAEEARLENSRIKDVNTKIETLKYKFLSKQTDHHESMNVPESSSTRSELKISDQRFATMGDEGRDMDLLGKKIREQLEVNSNSSLTVSELAEKIDELVNKVVTLETAVSSQTSLVKRLKSDTDVLQENVHSLEEDKEFLMESSENISKKLKELEEELARVKNLNQNVEIQNDNLQTQFKEASCDLDHLSGKLQTVKLDEEAENTELLQDVIANTDAKTSEEQEDKLVLDAEVAYSADGESEGKEDGTLKLSDFHIGEAQKQSSLSNNRSPVSEKPKESKQERENERPQPETTNIPLDLEANESGSEEEEKRPTLRQLFLKGLEERERLILEEYTSVLRDYKDVRNKLNEVEQKNRDSIFELAVQVKELKDAISSKDDVIQSLVSNPETALDTNLTGMKQELPHESINEAASPLYSEFSSPNLDQVSISNSFGEQSLELTERSYKSSGNSSLPQKEDGNTKVKGVNKTNAMSTMEERFRSDIDGLLEENLEFWLRFSTSVHQIQKFQTSIQDLQVEFLKLKENKQEGGMKQVSMPSDVRPIYRHLREIQTELSLWLEHNAVLKDELRGRFSSLCNIQNEITRVTDAGSSVEKTGLNEYQAAKFQGEVLNMKQENKKIADELQVGHGRVRGLQIQVEKTLEKLDQEFGISGAKSIQSQMKQSLSRARIPLRSFLFGVKLKRQKPSIFSCANPSLQKQYSDQAPQPPIQR